MLKTSTNELTIRHTQKHETETVLVLQDGGSLGAYECGVFKALAKHGIQFDIVSGTSIGAINAGIIAGSKSGKPEVDLEDFWMDVTENVTPPLLPVICEQCSISFPSELDLMEHKKIDHAKSASVSA